MIFILALLQSVMLTIGQVMLKFALLRMPPFGWTWAYFKTLLINWQFAACGAFFTAAGLLWMYILKHFPLSQAYPLVSLSYVMGMLAAVVFFREEVSVAKWLGVLLIMAGCALIAKP